jgi:predicted RNase H-like nuclease (RuvC/YqgF family)
MIKLKDSNYDKNTGISTAIIMTDLGEFYGESKLHEEDRAIESTFAGCHYAEMRAIIKYMKAKMQNLSYEINGVEKSIKMLMNLKDYNPNSIENRKLRKQLYIMKKEKQGWKTRIQSLSQKLYDNMMQREKIVSKMMQKGENK